MTLPRASFQRLFRAALFTLTGAVLLLFVVLIGSRLQVNEGLRTRIEQAVLDNAGLCVEIGAVRGNWWSGLTLQDVKLHGGPDKASAMLGQVPLIQVEYTALSFLSARPTPLRIDAYGPELAVVVGANRLMNLHPRFKAPHDEHPGEPPLPVDLVFHGGHVSYEVLAARRPFKVEVANLTGTGKLRGLQLELELQALREQDRINTHIDYDLGRQHGDLVARARGASLPYWVNRLGYAPEYEVTGGHGDLDLEAHWHDPMLSEELKLAGKARVVDGVVRLKNVAVPLEGLHGLVSFDEHVARVPGLAGTLAGMPISARGRVTRLFDPVPALGYPDQGYELALATPQVDLARLERLFPGLRSVHLAGQGAITAEVTGSASSPRVALHGVVPRGRYGLEPVERVAIEAVYTPGRLDLPRITLGLAHGEAVGHAFVGVPASGPVPYSLAAHFKGCELAEWLARYRHEPLPFEAAGRLEGDFALEGAGAHAVTTASVTVASGSLNHAPVQAASATYRYEAPQWQVARYMLAWGPTRLAGSARGTDQGPFHLDFDVASGDLHQWVHLIPTPPRTRIEGDASGHGVLEGPGADVNSWTGRAALQVAHGLLHKQAFSALAADMSLARNVVSFASLRCHAVGGLVRATGSYRPFMLAANEHPVTELEVSAVGMALGQVATLPASLKSAKGELAGRFGVHLHDQEVVVDGRLGLQQPRLPGWTRLDSADLRFHWTPELATLRPLTLARGADRYTVTGTIGQADDTYPLDLRLRAARADVRTLLGTVQWPDVMERLAPTHVREPAPTGPLREVGALAAALAIAPRDNAPFMHKRPATPGQLDLDQALARWAAIKKPPLNRAPPEAPLLPFWQESAGKLWLDAHLTGSILRPAIRLAASAERLTVFGRLIDQGAVVVGWDGDRLDLPRLRLVERGQVVLEGQGALGPDPNEQLHLQTHGLDLDWSRRALLHRQLRLEGRGDISLELAGPLAAPRARALVALRAGRFTGPGLEPIGFEAVDATLGYEHGRLAVQRAGVTQGGKRAAFEGSLPMTGDPRAAVDLAVRLEDGNLDLLNLLGQRRFQWLGGKGRLELRLSGTLGAPAIAGAVKLHDGSFKVAGLAEPVRGFAADVALDDRHIDIRHMAGELGGGTLDLAGRVFWEQFQPQRLDLALHAKPFKLTLPNDYFHGAVAADLRLAGPVDRPALSGRLALSEGVVDLRGEARGRAEGAPPPGVGLSDLDLVLGPGLRVKNSLVDVDITTLRRQGKLTLDGSLAAPQPRGVIIIEGGTIRPLNNPFKITEGKVEFRGERVSTEDDLLGILLPTAREASAIAGLNGRLDVQARTTAFDYHQNESVTVLAHVTGPLDQMDMRFTAEPLRSEQEILDILSKKQVLEGTFGGKLDRGEVIVKEVGGFVSSNLEEFISPYTLFMRNALDLQTFRIELVSDYAKQASLSDLAGYRPALTLETRPLWDRLSLGSRLVMGEFYTTSPTLNGDNTYVSLNLRLNRFLGLEYRINPYVDPTNDKVLGQTLGLRTQITF